MADVLCPKCGARNPDNDFITMCQSCFGSLKGAQPGSYVYERTRYSAWMTGDSFSPGLYRLEAGKSAVAVPVRCTPCEQ